ncbi:MAG TPA: YicC family protein [Thermoanaerobacterales bacterium]|nr:YicC family protein [Thermoanaerobacterales bacterium]
MVVSMTGYGRGEASSKYINFQVEIRSINHRYNDIRVRLPVSNIILEEKIKGLIKDTVSRGKVDVHITMEISGELKERLIYVDSAAIKAYYNAIEGLKYELGLEDKTDLSFLFSLPDVIKIQEPSLEEGEIWDILQMSINEAINNLIEMREKEGKELKNDLTLRINKIDKLINEIDEQSEHVVDYYREKLNNRINEILGGSYELNHERLEIEVAIMADKCDISEEITRINSHISQFLETLENDEPIGRKLDFILQELNREINTIGSKSNDAKISSYVIQIKSELEKLREQVQNIE